MNEQKRKKLEKKGWKVGNAQEFLGLTPEENEYLELKIELSQKLRTLRTKQNLTQTEFAKRINSSQSRVAKIENNDPSVSLDLIIRSLYSLGAKNKEIVKEISIKK